VIPYEDGVVQHPDIFNINRAFCCAPCPSLCLFALFVCDVFVTDILSFGSKNLKWFCASWSCNLYSGVFPGMDMAVRILRSILHRALMMSVVCSDTEDGVGPFMYGKNCILNLDGNISHIFPIKLNVIYAPFIVIESVEYIIRENIPPVIILFLMGLQIYMCSGLNCGISIVAIIL